MHQESAYVVPFIQESLIPRGGGGASSDLGMASVENQIGEPFRIGFAKLDRSNKSLQFFQGSLASNI
jgi:hypothetical protein